MISNMIWMCERVNMAIREQCRPGIRDESQRLNGKISFRDAWFCVTWDGQQKQWKMVGYVPAGVATFGPNEVVIECESKELLEMTLFLGKKLIDVCPTEYYHVGRHPNIELVEAARALVGFKKEHDITDRQASDGDGHYDVWMSSGLSDAFERLDAAVDAVSHKQ